MRLSEERREESGERIDDKEPHRRVLGVIVVFARLLAQLGEQI